MFSTLTATVYHPVEWYFRGNQTPALDVRTTNMPPDRRGSILVAFTFTVTEGTTPAEWARSLADEVSAWYYRQGITAEDVTRMTDDDVRQRTPVTEIRARTTNPAGRRGAVSSLKLWTVDNTRNMPGYG